MPLSRLVSILWNRGIEGVIFAPLQQRLSGTSPRRIEMDVGKFAAVEISETIESPHLDRATSDPYASMVRVLEEVHRAGYRRPGLVLEEALDFRVGGKWTAAFLRFHHSQTELPPPFLVVVPRQNEFDRWFERHRPDVIISVDRLGLRLLRGRGELVPGNVGYASLDIDGDRADFPEVSGIDQNSRLHPEGATRTSSPSRADGDRGQLADRKNHPAPTGSCREKGERHLRKASPLFKESVLHERLSPINLRSQRQNQESTTMKPSILPISTFGALLLAAWIQPSLAGPTYSESLKAGDEAMNLDKNEDALKEFEAAVGQAATPQEKALAQGKAAYVLAFKRKDYAQARKLAGEAAQTADLSPLAEMTAC
ncbi:MAG: tetratricopeptide repeat protein, partial [Verrucomicrobia bacterium]|nr:tetratricopeptide repeat protein [Verrucomicrobiota bacterium]